MVIPVAVIQHNLDCRSLTCGLFRSDQAGLNDHQHLSGFPDDDLVADADMPNLVRLYESIGFKPTEHRQAFGVDFQRMIYTV